MPNCDAGMTNEVHKCFHEQRRNWSVLPTRRLLIAAVAVCLAVCPATAPIHVRETKRFVQRADEKLTAFVELGRAIYNSAVSLLA